MKPIRSPRSFADSQRGKCLAATTAGDNELSRDAEIRAPGGINRLDIKQMSVGRPRQEAVGTAQSSRCAPSCAPE